MSAKKVAQRSSNLDDQHWEAAQQPGDIESQVISLYSSSFE